MSVHEAPPAWSAASRRAAFCIAAVGVALRLVRYAHGQSLYADALGADLLGRGLWDVLAPLEYVSPAPAGYLALVQLVVGLAGTGEFALRLVPLLCGCAAMVLFVPIVMRVLAPRIGLFVLALMATAWRLIDYSALSKHYATDAFVAVALLAVALRVFEDGRSRRRWIQFGCAGVAATLLSFPSIFVLSAVALASAERTRARARALLPLLALFGVVFALHYQAVAAGQWDRDWSESVWGERFAPFPPLTLADWTWYPRHVVGLFAFLFTRPEATAAGVAALCAALAGGCTLWRRDRRLLVLLAAPMALALAASALRNYPFAHRHLLFALPSCMLLIAVGIERLSAVRRGGRAAAIVVACLLLAPNAAKAAYTAFAPPPKQDMRALVAELAGTRLPGDLCYVLPAARPTFHYYRLTQHQGAFAGTDVIDGAPLPRGGGSTVAELIARSRGHRVWVVRANPGPEPLDDGVLDEIGRAGRVLTVIRASQVDAHLFELE